MRITIQRLLVLSLACGPGCSLSHNPDLPSLGGDSPIGDGDMAGDGDGVDVGDGDGDGDGDSDSDSDSDGAGGTGGADVLLGAAGGGVLGLGGLGGASPLEPPIGAAGGSTMGGSSSVAPEEN